MLPLCIPGMRSREASGEELSFDLETTTSHAHPMPSGLMYHHTQRTLSAHRLRLLKPACLLGLGVAAQSVPD